MKSFRIIAAGAVLLVGASIASSEFRTPAPTTVTITAQHSDGTPFSSLWVGLIADDRSAQPSAWLAKTDVAGAARFEVELPPGSSRAFIKVAGLGAATLAPLEERQSVREQASEVLPNYSFPKFLVIPLDPSITHYQATLVLHPSVRVSAQLVDEHGQADTGGMLAQINGFGMHTDVNRSSESDPLSIGGIRRGGTAAIAIFGPASPMPLVIELDETQTLDDIDLGPIHVPAYVPGSIPLHLTLTNGDQLLTRAVEAVEGGVEVLSSDGQTSITFALDPATGKMAHWPVGDQPETPRLHPGTYYIAPGPLGTSRADMLRQLLRAGVDVEAAGVPKIVAVEGQEVVLTVDAAAAERAILTAAGQ